MPLRASETLSKQLLQWVQERVPIGDEIRIPSIEKYQLIGDLGEGRFGTVRKYLNPDMVHEAGKVVKLEIFDHWGQDQRRVSHRLDLFIEEFRRLHKITFAHDRIVNVIGLYVDSSDFLVFSEYVPNGSVKQYLQKGYITEDTAVRYLGDVVEALDYLHTLNPPIIHRDIKATNLMITISDSIKLANFGLLRDLAVDGFGIAVASDITMDFRGTLLYVAPEVLTSELGPGNRKAYGLPADIWALGCTFIEMLVRFPPYFEYFGQVGRIQNEIVERASGTEGSWLPYSADVFIPSSSTNVKNLVNRMFERQPSRRPTTKELLALLDRKTPQSPTSVHTVTFDCPPSTSRNFSPVVSFEDEATGYENQKRLDQPEYTPMETLHNAVIRTPKKKKKETPWSRLKVFVFYYLSRLLFFLRILSKSVFSVLTFITIGVCMLAFFLFLAYFIVLFFRYLIKVNCQCDISAPQYLVISGILLILLFALMFSCCMVAIGEIKHRINNGLFDNAQKFRQRPQGDITVCGIPLFRGSQDDDVVVENPMNEDHDDDGEDSSLPTVAINQKDFYYC